MIAITLREIAEATFNKSERTLFDEYRDKNPQRVKTFKPFDAVMFVSKTGNQIQIVHVPQIVSNGDAPLRATVLGSKRLRILNGTWNPLMLRNYAEMAGYELKGIKRFEDFVKVRSAFVKIKRQKDKNNS